MVCRLSSIAGSRFLQAGESLTEWRKDKLTVMKKVRFFGLNHASVSIYAFFVFLCHLETMLIRLQSN